MTPLVSLPKTHAEAALLRAYTDASELHPNLLVASLQLLIWLLFHPSAWRNYVTQLDPALSPDFALAELQAEQWRNPGLRRLLLMSYGVLPLLAGLLISLIPWWVVGLSSREVLANVLICLAYGVVTSLAVGATVSVAVGIVYGTAISLAACLAPDALVNLIAHQPSAYLIGGRPPAELMGILRVILFGLAAGMAGNIAITAATKKQHYSLIRQVGGFVSGLVISGALLTLAYAVASGAALGLPSPGRVGEVVDLAAGVAYGLAGGLLFGLTYGLIVGLRTRQGFRSLVIGFGIGLGGGLAYGVAVTVGFNTLIYYVAVGIGGSLLYGGVFAFSYNLVERIAGTWAGAVAGACVSGLCWLPLAPYILRYPPPLWPTLALVVLAILLGLQLTWWRPILLYFPLGVWNSFLVRKDEQGFSGYLSALRWHSAFWDEHQRLPLLGLDEHLVLVAERNQTEGQAAIDYLINTSQRWAAQAAQVELEARWLEACTTVQAIGSIHHGLGVAELVGPASALLRSFSRISQDVRAALHQESAYNQRLALNAVEDRLDSLLRELTRSSERYAVRFRSIAARWRQIVADYAQELAATVESRQEIDSPYVIGVPLTTQQEIFVGRTDISARIEQLLLDQRRLPLLLYGQRRMGKTSLLNNLGRLLPTTILPLFIDLQGPATQASDHAGFLYNFARAMSRSAQQQRGLTLPALNREALATDPFTGFDEWLDEVELTLDQNTALIALDEFEALEAPINDGRFSESAVMSMFRHLIQHRPRFKVLLTGSHSLDEFGRWASYLINVQIVHISYLNETEARQLIEQPVRDFALRYEPAASQRVLDLTRGHPFLIQLLCAEIVALKNEQDTSIRRLARLADVEEAMPAALSHGSFFFADIQRNQLDALAVEVLRFMAAKGEGAIISAHTLEHHFPTDLAETVARLTRRQLIEPASAGYRFQVELIRRWFAQL